MTLYSRHQILFVLLLSGAAGFGLAVDHWRRARPDLVERLERLDRAVLPEARRSASEAPRPSEAARPRGPARAAERFPAPAGAAVDVNRASEEELAALPGIGRAIASRIVAARPFGDVADLQRVRGLRRAALDRLRPRLVAGATTPAAILPDAE
jgi:competence protein ComEA